MAEPVRPSRVLSQEQFIARQQAHAKIDEEFGGRQGRKRSTPAWMRADFEVDSATSGQDDFSEREQSFCPSASEQEPESDAPNDDSQSTSLSALVETLLKVAAQDSAGCDTTIRALAALVLEMHPPLEDVLKAVTVLESRLLAIESPAIAVQCEWVALLLAQCDAAEQLDERGAELQINAARRFMVIGPDNGRLACALVCALLPQWAARLDVTAPKWPRQLQSVCHGLRIAQRNAWRDRGGGVAAIAALNAQAAVVLHWAANCAAGEGGEASASEEEAPLPEFVLAVVHGLLEQLDELAAPPLEAEDAAERAERDAIGLAAATGLGDLMRGMGEGAAPHALLSPDIAQLLPAAAECARAAADGGSAGAASAASGAVACLLGLAGDNSAASAWRVLLGSAPAEAAELVEALLPLVRASSARGPTPPPLQLRAAAAALLSAFVDHVSEMGAADEPGEGGGGGLLLRQQGPGHMLLAAVLGDEQQLPTAADGSGGGGGASSSRDPAHDAARTVPFERALATYRTRHGLDADAMAVRSPTKAAPVADASPIPMDADLGVDEGSA